MDFTNSSVQDFPNVETTTLTEGLFAIQIKQDPLVVGLSCVGLFIVILSLFLWWFFRSPPDEDFDQTRTFDSRPELHNSQETKIYVQNTEDVMETMSIFDENTTRGSDDEDLAKEPMKCE